MFQAWIYFIKRKDFNINWYYSLLSPREEEHLLVKALANRCNSMSLSYHCGRILAHSPLRNCFNSATLEGRWAWTACLRSCHSISIGFTPNAGKKNHYHFLTGTVYILPFFCRSSLYLSLLDFVDNELLELHWEVRKFIVLLLPIWIAWAFEINTVGEK